ncbi:hypothetical protein FISHEDRAFT_43031 [Fistulina hepatica ATCC 64428]|uniref:Uncharacterized protein n=1 Tax=Fistulina hepatica ATCC 64428 TaxID=1128425 RepID=A0A0D7ABY4_9AGAR|nr:hypothetical protein FISHEDRAFT_43031 [Fistulina hepatica ATCC 64428]
MWHKFTGALKSRQATIHDDEPGVPPTPQGDVLSRVLDQHPNLSVFHNTTDFPATEPPPSPKRRGVFKRMAKVMSDEQDSCAPLHFKLPGTFSKNSKKVGSTLTLNGNADTPRRSSFDMLKQPAQPADGRQPSADTYEPPRIPRSSTDGAASVRSILRDPNTPGTGQNVRFFSRDAYKVISPEQSMDQDSPEGDDLQAKLQGAAVGTAPAALSPRSRSKRPTVAEVFSLPTTSVPADNESIDENMPGNSSNPFDVSWQDVEMPGAPPGLDFHLDLPSDLSTALREDLGEVISRSSAMSHASAAVSDLSASNDSQALVDRSDLRALASPMTSLSKNRARAISDTVFHSMLRSSSGSEKSSKHPESEVNDESSGDVIVFSPEKKPDPFSATANTYYTPQTMIPSTPPQGSVRSHCRMASKEESIIVSLQAQLTLQSELCGQYENDLHARDEAVTILESRLSEAERDAVKRREYIRNMRKKLQDVERHVRSLQEEVETSRQENQERSIMDEASGEALRMLHRQIAALQKEKDTTDEQAHALRAEVDAVQQQLKSNAALVTSLTETLQARDQRDHELQHSLREAQEQVEEMGNVSMCLDEDDMKRLIAEKEMRNEEERERYLATEAEWKAQKTELNERVEAMRTEINGLQDELEDSKVTLKDRDSELAMLKTELETQWTNTEKATEKLTAMAQQVIDLQDERDALRTAVQELEQKITEMELGWNEIENRRTELETELHELWDEKDLLEHEKEEIEVQLKAQTDRVRELDHALQVKEEHVATVEQERQFATENTARVTAQLSERDAENAALRAAVEAHEREIEDLREQMNTLGRGHARDIESLELTVTQLREREAQSKATMERLAQEKADADVDAKTSQDRFTSLDEEVQRLRRHVHDLQKESADKEVKLVALEKQREKDQTDIFNYNMALDSKQQELELLKRKMQVRGTGGSTPIQANGTATPASNRSLNRRESSISSTLGSVVRTGATTRTSSVASRGSSVSSRSSSVMSNGSAHERQSSTESVRSPALMKSTRANTGAMRPPLSKPRISGVLSPTSTSTPTPKPRTSAAAAKVSSRVALAGSTPGPRRVSSTASELAKLKSKSVRASLVAESQHKASGAPAVSDVDEDEEKENMEVSLGSQSAKSMSSAGNSTLKATKENAPLKRKIIAVPA